MGDITYNFQALQEARLRKCVRYIEIAKALNLDTSTIHQTINGKRKSLETISRIAEFLGVPKHKLEVRAGNGSRKRRAG